MSKPLASVTLTLDDGSGCYVVVVPVDSFGSRDVARAAGDAAATFIETYVASRALDGPWDPVAWRARFDSMTRSQQWRDRDD